MRLLGEARAGDKRRKLIGLVVTKEKRLGAKRRGGLAIFQIDKSHHNIPAQERSVIPKGSSRR